MFENWATKRWTWLRLLGYISAVWWTGWGALWALAWLNAFFHSHEKLWFPIAVGSAGVLICWVGYVVTNLAFGLLARLFQPR